MVVLVTDAVSTRISPGLPCPAGVSPLKAEMLFRRVVPVEPSPAPLASTFRPTLVLRATVLFTTVVLGAPATSMPWSPLL